VSSQANTRCLVSIHGPIQVVSLCSLLDRGQDRRARSLLSRRLREMRRRSGLTQEDVARHLNVTRGAVGHWERGKNQPPYDILVKIARLHNTSTAYLVGEIDDPAPLMNVSTE